MTQLTTIFCQLQTKTAAFLHKKIFGTIVRGSNWRPRVGVRATDVKKTFFIHCTFFYVLTFFIFTFFIFKNVYNAYTY